MQADATWGPQRTSLVPDRASNKIDLRKIVLRTEASSYLTTSNDDWEAP